jgi:hypothetical protein
MLDMRREYGRYDRQREIPTERSNR